MSGIVQTLLPVPAAAAVLGVVGALAGPYLARYASARTVAQPLAMELEAETEFLVGILADLRRLPYVVSIAADDFAAGAHHRIWSALLDAVPECRDLPDNRTEDDCEQLGLSIQERREDVLSVVWTALQAGPAPVGDGERLQELLRDGTDAIDDVAVVEAGHKVLYAGQDRNRTAGSGLVMPTSTPDSADPARPPLHRVHTPPSRLRTVASGVATAVGAALIPAFTSGAGFSGLSAALAGGALAAMLTLSVIIALVDLDTFYIDVRTFLITAGAAWGLTIAADAANGSLGRITGGLVIVAATAALFEIVNRVYRLVRGVDGQGLGDSLIVLATVAIPPALTGHWTLGYYSVMAGMLTSVGGWIIGFARGRLTRTTPYAFGPYLAAGWVVGWVIALLAA